MAPKNDMKWNADSSSSGGEIEAIILELAAARRAGQAVDYAAAEQAHQKLMPELGNRIRVIRAMEMAAVTPGGASSAEEYATSMDLDQNSAAEFLREALEGYEILEQCDYGGQGRVFKAIQTATNRTVAIKVLLDGPLATKRHRDRFIREIELVSRLKDPGIVTVYDSGTLRDRPYLVMEFVDGLPIDDYVCAERPDVKGRIQLFLQVCDAIAAAHRHGIIHRDLKPANILVDGAGRVHVLDFGLAKEVGDPSCSGTRAVLSQTGLIVGTLRYLSPEQTWGHTGNIDTRSDIYTLGVVLFELLTGLPPYPTNGARENVLQRIRFGECSGLRQAIGIAGGDGVVEAKHIDCDLETILSRSLAKEPDRRYQSVVALSDDLERYVRGDVIEARGDSNLYLLQRTFTKFRVHVTVAVAFLVIILGALVGMTILWKRADATIRTAQIGLDMGAFVRRAGVHRRAREYDRAVAMQKQALELVKFVSTDDPLVRRQIYSAHHGLATLYFMMNHLEDASRHCDEAIAMVRVLRKAQPDELDWFRLEGYSHKLRGELEYRQQNWEESFNHFRKMVAVQKEVADREPEIPFRQVELGEAHWWAGKASRKMGQLDVAVQHLLAACRIGERPCETVRDNIDYAIRLSVSEATLAVAYMSYHTPANDSHAFTWLDRARHRLKELLKAVGIRAWKHRITEKLAAIDENITKLNARKAGD